jgi:iron complex transport system substrate-binding protein
MMKIFYHLLLVFQVLLFVLGCKSHSRENKDLITITDMLGRTVEVPKNVRHVVGLKPGALRMLSYLGVADMIAGVEEIEKQNKNPYNFANPQYADLPVIGPPHGGDAELIALAKPDIIFITYATVSEADKLQNKTGIPVIALQYGDLSQNKETFYKALRLMAKPVNKTERADSLIRFIDSIIADLDQRTKEIAAKHAPKVYAGGISFKGAHGISSTTPDFAPLEYINTKNLAWQFTSSGNNVYIDKEQLIKWNPEKIFIDYGGWGIVHEELKKEALTQTLNAIKNNEIYLLLPYNWYTTNFATVIVDSYYAGSVLFPEAFPDMDMEEKANSIYRAFLQKPVYSEMTRTFGSLKHVDLQENETRGDK